MDLGNSNNNNGGGGGANRGRYWCGRGWNYKYQPQQHYDQQQGQSQGGDRGERGWRRGPQASPINPFGNRPVQGQCGANRGSRRYGRGRRGNYNYKLQQQYDQQQGQVLEEEEKGVGVPQASPINHLGNRPVQGQGGANRGRCRYGLGRRGDYDYKPQQPYGQQQGQMIQEEEKGIPHARPINHLGNRPVQGQGGANRGRRRSGRGRRGKYDYKPQKQYDQQQGQVVEEEEKGVGVPHTSPINPLGNRLVQGKGGANRDHRRYGPRRRGNRNHQPQQQCDQQQSRGCRGGGWGPPKASPINPLGNCPVQGQGGTFTPCRPDSAEYCGGRGQIQTNPINPSPFRAWGPGPVQGQDSPNPTNSLPVRAWGPRPVQGQGGPNQQAPTNAPPARSRSPQPVQGQGVGGGPTSEVWSGRSPSGATIPTPTTVHPSAAPDGELVLGEQGASPSLQHESRLISGDVPTLHEAEQAISDYNTLLRDHQSPNSTTDSFTTQIHNVVVSLISDSALWNAVCNNEEVNEVFQSLKKKYASKMGALGVWFLEFLSRNRSSILFVVNNLKKLCSRFSGSVFTEKLALILSLVLR